jgi:hypothetical protein
LLNKPTLWTASWYDVWNNAWEIPVIDNNGHLDPSIVPSTWVMTTYTVTNKSDLTTLTTAVKWDIWIVTSENKTYILSQDPYSTLANWTELLFPTGSVSSVNWFTGAVNLTTWYISESWDNLFVSSVEKATWNNKLGSNNVSTVALTWNYNDLNNKPIVDTAISNNSTNAVQNKVIKSYVDSTISNNAYGSWWDGDITHAPSKNAVYDEMNSIENNITTLQNTTGTAVQDISNIKWDITNLQNALAWKQDTLVSGTNIKTINGESVLGSWDIDVSWIITSWSTFTSFLTACQANWTEHTEYCESGYVSRMTTWRHQYTVQWYWWMNLRTSTSNWATVKIEINWYTIHDETSGSGWVPDTWEWNNMTCKPWDVIRVYASWYAWIAQATITEFY